MLSGSTTRFLHFSDRALPTQIDSGSAAIDHSEKSRNHNPTVRLHPDYSHLMRILQGYVLFRESSLRNEFFRRRAYPGSTGCQPVLFGSLPKNSSYACSRTLLIGALGCRRQAADDDRSTTAHPSCSELAVLPRKSPRLREPAVVSASSPT